MTTFLIATGVAFTLFVLLGFNLSRNYKRLRKQLQFEISQALSNDLIGKPDYQSLNVMLLNNAKPPVIKQQFEESQASWARIKRLYTKYPEEEVLKITRKEYWLGMTEGHLKEMRGDPTNVEKEVSKDGVITKFIYGNKNSGDVFVFDNGVLTSYKDR